MFSSSEAAARSWAAACWLAGTALALFETAVWVLVLSWIACAFLGGIR
jgi:hypothetical protein